MKRNFKTDIIGWIVGIVVAGLVFAIGNYLCVPRIGWSFGFLFLIAFSLGMGAVASLIVGAASYDEYEGVHPSIFTGIATGIIILAILVSWIVGWQCFHVDEIKARLDVTEITQEELVEMLPDVNEEGAYSWADSATARKLATRKTGELTELVSIFTVSNTANTAISEKGLVKYVPMEYAGFLKAMKSDNIPGYVDVNPVKQSADYKEHVIRYSPSAYFAYDLIRHARNCMPNEYFGHYSFQVSPEGEPTWVIELERTCNSWSVREVYAVALINAETGACEKYELANAPAWVVSIHGDTAQAVYNGYGRMINGFWNLSGVGQTTTTNDFGYVAINGEMYYTFGITSAVVDGGDESNLGVMLYNAHTNKAYYCKVAGAEEYSAMEAAEGVVQNFGYEAAFPSLTNVDGNLTYVMVLKDSNGIVKQYGMVNYDNYTIAVTADSLNACRVAYAKAMAKGGNVKVDESITETVTITVDTIEYIVQGGETVVYVRDTNNNVYKSNFDESFLFVKNGDTITITVMDNGDTIKMMTLGKTELLPETEFEATAPTTAEE